ncbi:hypothetical protein HK104_009342 [Borealophlyctis nickersoniae]|nr:hypothetical protein HK104_009342 [Borealophlyctis nickersoniae]
MDSVGNRVSAFSRLGPSAGGDGGFIPSRQTKRGWDRADMAPTGPTRREETLVQGINGGVGEVMAEEVLEEGMTMPLLVEDAVDRRPGEEGAEEDAT